MEELTVEILTYMLGTAGLLICAVGSCLRNDADHDGIIAIGLLFLMVSIVTGIIAMYVQMQVT